MKRTLPRITFPRFSLKDFKVPSYLLRKKSGHIGMVLEDRGLRYAEVHHDAQTIHIKKAGFFELDSGLIERGKLIDCARIESELSTKVQEEGLKGKKAIISLPSSSVFIRKVLLPPVPEKEVRMLLEVELESTVHVPFQRPYFDYYKLEQAPNGEAEEEQEQYWVVAAPGDLVDQYIELFSVLRIELVAAEIEPLALYRVLAKYRAEEEEFIIVQLGLHSVNVFFFKGDIPEFVRNIPIDLTNYNITLDERGMQSYSLIQYMEDRGMFDGFARDLIRELERVLTFYEFNMKKDGTRISKMYLTGDFPNIEKIISILQENIKHAEVTRFPAEHIFHPFTGQDEVQAYMAPIGLAMRG
ncbi:Tfp pilus assembly protein, ATPase PilM [Aneurinibacillus thermoaerophilus]|uniref:Pilus assembly protein PilM n=1 Tax=Aneurinibacillus thermoaerophilus TaxID=143495 RepID=A0A1G7ZRW6_ANETH|nr:pilus assembly protein PilM [Aneurinibacillus thermoaerophilus]QYY42117.1 pilus assembly protein PilM [Aneurinibacillus thermoaerophilus]SDH11441.1 Tfp pilus assembly protein, ATPase PilM [Aneurinibacillus thermoaerophilus]